MAQFAGTTIAVKTAQSDAAETVDDVSTAVFEALSDLRFDDDTLDLDEEDYYSEDGPDPEPVLEEVLQEYAGRVSRAFSEGRLTDGMTVYLGVYEGIQSAIDPAYDNYGIIGDYPEQVLAVWNRLLETDLTNLAQRVIAPEQVQLALRQLADRVHHFDESEYNAEELYFDLKDFEPLLLAMITDMPSAREVQRAIDLHHWQKLGTEYVQLRIADVLRDPDLWLQTADQFAEHDAVIGLQLLQRLLQTNDRAALLASLHRLTRQFPRTFDPFILDHLDPSALAAGNDLNLYLTALENRCRDHGQVADYRRLRDYYPEEQRRRFADSLVNKAGYVQHPLFYAQVLHTENRLADLLAFVKRLDWLNVRGMADILKLIAPTYPNECMDMTMERTTDYLDNGQRGRAVYQAIASWLTALNQFQPLKPQVAIYAEHLYKTYSRLSTLREELRTARLVVSKR